MTTLRRIPEMSVVIASYGRPTLLARLLSQLALQTFPTDAFEVIVIDDGSPKPVSTTVDAARLPYTITVERQPNAGAAAARHRGAELARADIVLFLDDDMQIPPTLLAAHFAAHADAPHAVVLGDIRPDPSTHHVPIFERFHARKLTRYIADLRATGRAPKGSELCTGNVSLRRADYFAVGGFDASLGHSEDAELGLRLEKAGAQLRLCDAAFSVHRSDHSDLEAWLRRAYMYGVFDRRIARKHPEIPHADPWRYFRTLRWGARPFMGFAVLAPGTSRLLANGAIRTAIVVDALGGEDLALAFTTLAYAIQYTRGMRAEEGSLLGALRSFGEHLRLHVGRERAIDPLRSAWNAVREDHRMLQRADEKYARGKRPKRSLGNDLVRRIGFQMLAVYRVMRLLDEIGVPMAPQLVSRLIRLAYGADIHWNARIDPGVVIVHGMGLAISGSARVGARSFLSQNVCIGDGIDATTRVTGAPTLEEDVHVGPGASILGPITVGAGSKVGAGVVVQRTVPPDSLVESPLPRVRSRFERSTRAALTSGSGQGS